MLFDDLHACLCLSVSLSLCVCVYVWGAYCSVSEVWIDGKRPNHLGLDLLRGCTCVVYAYVTCMLKGPKQLRVDLLGQRSQRIACNHIIIHPSSSASLTPPYHRTSSSFYHASPINIHHPTSCHQFKKLLCKERQQQQSREL